MARYAWRISSLALPVICFSICRTRTVSRSRSFERSVIRSLRSQPQLRVHRSTVSRELKRNGDVTRYDPGVAHKLARGKRSRRPDRIIERDGNSSVVLN